MNLVKQIHIAVEEAEAEAARELHPALVLMNTAFCIGKVYGLLDVLNDTDFDGFVTEYAAITDRLHRLMKKNDAIYRSLKEVQS